MCFVTFAGHRFALPAHGAVELLLGFAAGVLPFVLGLTTGATIIFVVAAALLITVAIDGSITDEQGYPAIAPLSHRGLDLTLVLALAAGAVAVAVIASTAGGLALLSIAAAELLLVTLTRYSAPA